MSIPLNPVPRPQIVDKTGNLTTPWQAWFAQLYQFATATVPQGGALTPASRNINTTAPLAGGGNLSADLTLSVTVNGITNAFLAQMAANTLKGNNAGALGNALDLTPSQVTAMLSLFTSTLKGLVPASGGGTTTYLRADGTWAAPGGTTGVSAAITTAKLTTGGTNGSMTFVNGLLTAQTQAT